MPVLGRFRVNLDHPTLDALDLGGAETGLALGADGGLVLTVSRLKAVVLAGWRYQRTSFPVRRGARLRRVCRPPLPKIPRRPQGATAERPLRASRLCKEPGQHRHDPLRTPGDGSRQQDRPRCVSGAQGTGER